MRAWPSVLSACKLAEPRTVQASPLRLQSNGRTLRQVVSRFIRSAAATILPSDFEKFTALKGLAPPSSAVPVPFPDHRPLLLPLLPAGDRRPGRCAPPQDLLNHPTTPRALSASKLAKPQTVQASPLRRQSNGRELRQVVSRFIRSAAAAIPPGDREKVSEPGDWLRREDRVNGLLDSPSIATTIAGLADLYGVAL